MELHTTQTEHQSVPARNLCRFLDPLLCTDLQVLSRLLGHLPALLGGKLHTTDAQSAWKWHGNDVGIYHDCFARRSSIRTCAASPTLSIPA